MFSEQVIIITGGSSGIGKALAERLVGQGAHLALVARDEAKLAAVREELTALALPGRKVETFSCNVADALEVERTVPAIVEQLGSPDVLINCAGILRESYFEKQSLETFHEIMDINFYGTLHMIKAVLPHFKQKGRGRIVNMSSVAGLMGVFGYAAYCSSKHALTGLTHTLRFELRPQGIKLHIVYPPETETPMLRDIKGRSIENKKIAHTIPVLKVEQVADEIIRGITQNKYEIIPGAVTRAICWANRVLPSVSRAVVDLRIRKYYQGPDKETNA